MWFTHRNKILGINLDFVQEQRITFEIFCEIIALHKERSDLYELLTNTKDQKLMKILFGQLTQVEFEIQMLWGFEPNSIRHMSWRWPHCTCPRMDNQDAFPYYQYMTQNCPLHGNITKKIAPKLNKPKKYVTS